MFDKDRFHNQLALNLGYQRIVYDKRINISIDEKQYPDDVMITIGIEGLSKPIFFKASENPSQSDMDHLEESYEDIKKIIVAVHHAYLQATTNPF